MRPLLAWLLVATLGACGGGAAARSSETALRPRPPRPPRPEERDEARCDRGDAEACYSVALSLEFPEGEEKRGDDEEKRAAMRPWLEKACRKRHASACFHLAAYSKLGSVEHRSLMERSCDEGDAIACASLGQELLREDPDRAYFYLRQACDLGGTPSATEACAMIANRP